MSPFDLVLSLLVLFGGQDSLSLIDSEAYWKMRGMPMEEKHLLPMLAQAPVDQQSDPEPWLAKLGDRDPGVRREAREKLAAMGARIRPQLEARLKDPDPEIAMTARELLQAMPAGATPGELDRISQLMVIRTLGELKSQAAVPRLKQLVDSERPFEGWYAACALAAIAGEPAPKPDWPSAAERAARADALVDRLPADSRFIARVVLPTDSLEPTFEAAMGPPMGLPPDQAMHHVRKHLTRYLAPILQNTGNFRLDAAVMAMGGTPDAPSFTLVVDGLWDGTGVLAAAQAPDVLDGIRLGACKSVTLAGRPALQFERQSAVLVDLAPNRLLIGARENGVYDAEATIRALLAPEAPAEPLPAMREVLDAADRQPNGWGVAKADPLWRLPIEHSNPILGELQDLRITATPAAPPAENPGDRAFDVVLTASVEKPKSRQLLQEWIGALKDAGVAAFTTRANAAMPQMRGHYEYPLDLVSSIEITTTETGVKLTARVPYAVFFVHVSNMMPLVGPVQRR